MTKRVQETKTLRQKEPAQFLVKALIHKPLSNLRIILVNFSLVTALPYSLCLCALQYANELHYFSVKKSIQTTVYDDDNDDNIRGTNTTIKKHTSRFVRLMALISCLLKMK